jgi:hypothetical protein
MQPSPTPDTWDYSSLHFDPDYGCQGACEEMRAKVCNGDSSGDMAGPSTWELYWIASGNPKEGVAIASGSINALAAGECQVLTYNPADNPDGASGSYIFKAYQRPGHAGTGVLWSNSCELLCPLLSDLYPTAQPTQAAVQISFKELPSERNLTGLLINAIVGPWGLLELPPVAPDTTTAVVIPIFAVSTRATV